MDPRLKNVGGVVRISSFPDNIAIHVRLLVGSWNNIYIYIYIYIYIIYIFSIYILYIYLVFTKSVDSNFCAF